jgi:hypothetical protein
VIRVCSPLLLAAIAGACCWLWYTIKEYLSQETLPAHVQLHGSIQPSSPVELRSSTTPSMREMGQRAEPSLPLTPIPPILSNASADQESTQHTRQEVEREESTPSWKEVPKNNRLSGQRQMMGPLQRPMLKTSSYQEKRRCLMQMQHNLQSRLPSLCSKS